MAWEMNPNSVPQTLSLKHLLSTHLFTSTQMPLLQKTKQWKNYGKKRNTKLSHILLQKNNNQQLLSSLEESQSSITSHTDCSKHSFMKKI